ncbi:copper chaperone PCu(A)C [Marinobacter caseinilyticus]|uniref:copper chaperone PCu(A)C n=1 Tax=Marinobacter caseinilyticus TaxID=2692195 RepID=UPI00140C568F|nr:copper chaperone PCu(A)C [Marinobacter caseinilyticus]
MKHPHRLFLMTCLNLLIALPVSAHDYRQGDISVAHPWTRPTPPGVPMAVGYMVITNHSDQPMVLVSAQSSMATRVSLHESQMQAGVMRMQALDNGLTIPAGSQVELKPHSYHLMLENIAAQLKPGTRVPLILKFSQGSEIALELSVDPLDGAMKGGMNGAMEGVGAPVHEPSAMDHGGMKHDGH